MSRRITRAPAGCVVVITGAARGIGAATAELFAAQGATVWIGDVDRSEAEATAAVPLGSFLEETRELTDLILDVNLRGVLNGMRAVVPEMVRHNRGRVINVASMAGMIPIPGMVTYNASKFAVLGASLAARRELAPAGVTVSAILPAAVRTELASGAPLGGSLPTVDPGDVAAAIVKAARTEAARVSVPRWVAPGWSMVTSIDAAGRRGYAERIARQADAHAGSRPAATEVDA